MSGSMERFRVPPDRLRWICDPEKLPVASTGDILPCADVVGQARALSALRLGLHVHSPGYNIYLAGYEGTGRGTAIACLLEELDRGGETPEDLAYVHSFQNPDAPRLLQFPAGKGARFQKEMAELTRALRRAVPGILEGEEFRERSSKIVERYQAEEKSVIREFEEKLRKANFSLVQVQMGPFIKPDIAPLIAGNAVNMEQLENLAEEGRFAKEDLERVRQVYHDFTSEMHSVFKQARNIQKRAREHLENLRKEMVLPIVEMSIQDLKEDYQGAAGVGAYLDEVREHVLEEIDRFAKSEEEEAKPSPIPGFPVPPAQDPFLEYQVNVLVDNSLVQGPPIIYETSPSYKNLFGTIERVVDRTGVLRSDFSRIKAGSFLRANGGYLILNVMDVLLESGVWPALKRTLRNRKVEIQTYDPFYLLSTSAMKPEPIDARVKLLLMGPPLIYHLLYALDEDFSEIFKVKADFDEVMKREEDSSVQYASVIRKICDQEGLLPLDRTGLARVMEYGVRLAGRRNKISTKFRIIADVVREAAYWAQAEGSEEIRDSHVERSLRERVERSNLLEEKVRELIENDTLMIDTAGAKVGQVNGLSVVSVGDHAFGHPTKITAQTALGQRGIINIEREADLSGKTHNKGVLILSGFIAGRHARDKPLAVSASIAFEQSYSGVEGDSASSTEAYAILSSLAEVPLRQEIAVTGSINQKGEIQPIGGVNQKIEGFFDVCKAKGLTGTQGVMIPAANVEDLMLRLDVVEAVAGGTFHIYAIRTIDEGIEVLTGMSAGELAEEGQYPEGTFNALVDEHLRQMAEDLKFYSAAGEERADEGERPAPSEP